MTSVRLGSELEGRLRKAAEARGESPSEFIRQAVTDRTDATLAFGAAAFDNILGVVRGGGGRARRTGEAFTDVLTER